MELLTFPTIDLSIEKNASKARRKKALPAFERNSIGPLNQALFSIPTTSNNAETSTVTDTIESVTNTIEVNQTNSNTNLPQKRGRGRPRKTASVQKNS
ncbi:unnamed protein product [Brachionus calyciflorus]|uniref:Uncharacterized protein n=1 Tax=Brachionus calyciflorus TaxID=104777 RepID=A0A814HNK4_9BILA|nr:unnamed protein product [Brachionus calyciflorus]